MVGRWEIKTKMAKKKQFRSTKCYEFLLVRGRVPGHPGGRPKQVTTISFYLIIIFCLIFFVLEEEECEKQFDVTMWVFAVQKNSKSIENRASEFFVQETHYDKYKMNRCG